MLKVGTQLELVSALETIESVEIVNKDEFLGIVGYTNELCRDLHINIGEVSYVIKWYHNLSSIRSEFMQSSFDSIVLNTPTWPLRSDSKLKLQLMCRGQLAVII